METLSVNLWNNIPSAYKRVVMVARSERPDPPEASVESRIQLRRSHDRDSVSLDRLIRQSRVLIVEGISGSGKDTFQRYLKTKLKDRDVYDYSEGEVMHSWKQMQIQGIFELRIKFMKCFVNYVRDIVSRNENAVFLLNRFHLSTFASTIIQNPKLEKEYDEIIDVLKMLPVHIFILQLEENEIEKKSLHPERSGAWQKFRQQIDKDGFCGRLERQQTLILEAAERQQIPYSIIKVSYEPEIRDQQVQ